MKLLLSRIIIALSAAAMTTILMADESNRKTYNLAVLAVYQTADEQTRWAPLAARLEAQSGKRVQLQILDEPQMLRGFHNGQIDIALIHPSLFVRLQAQQLVGPPLASVVSQQNGVHTEALGGVAFARDSYEAPTTWGDIKNMRIATPGMHWFAAYQIQLYEMRRNGLTFDTGNLITTNGSQEDVVDAVANKRADVGFVRTGVLEHFAESGKFSMQTWRIIQPRILPQFPFVSSTPLYPEWPVAIRRDASASSASELMRILQATPKGLVDGIGGFTVAADYSVVSQMMHEMRMPPFEGGMDRLVIETWNEHPFFVTLLILLGVGLIGLAARLVVAHRRLQNQSDRMKGFIDYAMDAMVQMDSKGLITGWNRRAETMFGWTSHEAVGKPLDQLLVPLRFRDAHNQGLNHYLKRPVNNQSSKMINNLVQTTALRRSGEEFPVEIFISELKSHRKIEFSAYIRDITLRQSQLKKLQFAASVFKHAREGITITDVDGQILDVNDMFSQITGYEAHEVIGKNPKVLKSGRQDAAFYQEMWDRIFQDGYWSGEIWNRRKNGDIYPELLTISAVKDEFGLTSHYVGLFSDITVVKNHQQHLEFLAHYDPLTELPNRVLLLDRLRQALLHADRTDQWVAVAYLDLDGFKEVNDTYGHVAGDRLLATLAKRMKSAMRASDTLARVGGDEFIAVISGGNGDDLHLDVLPRILNAVKEPVLHENSNLQVTTSIGVTSYPRDEGDADHLIRNADQAMYEAKRQGKNQIFVFDPSLDASAVERHDRLREIDSALQSGHMALFYQPKIDLVNGQVIGLEALIRWIHPQKGILSPGTFLPLIEGHELEVRLGDWVIAEAIAQRHKWYVTGISTSVSVNIAAQHLQCGDFSSRLNELLSATKSHGIGLQIEILETSALDNLSSTRQQMMEVMDLGVGFALDDFGTGYSSLSYLRHLPIEHIKIDQSFVRAMLHDSDDRAIVRAIISLARSFNIKVVAEGVETVKHVNLLRELGCDIAQGYAIGKPMPANELEGWLRIWQTTGWSQLLAEEKRVDHV